MTKQDIALQILSQTIGTLVLENALVTASLKLANESAPKVREEDSEKGN